MGVVGLGRGFIGDLQLGAGSQTKKPIGRFGETRASTRASSNLPPWRTRQKQLDDSESSAQICAELRTCRLGARVKSNWTIRRAPRKYARSFESHAYAPQGAYSSAPAQIKKAPLRELLLFVLAERVGFEPTVRFNVRLISSQVHSTTLPPLHLLRSFPALLREGKIIAAA
jgi:hypothetical protein